MKQRHIAAAILFISALVVPATADDTHQPSFTFRDVGYFHRWSKDTQHEFTPAGQEDLQKWADMITINDYPGPADGDRLAAMANSVLENYKANKAILLQTNSVPRTPTQPAEHMIAVVFPRAQFIEAAFARFRIVDGGACSIVYSHRIYSEKAGDQMSAWLQANGLAVEKALMAWNAIPSPQALGRELRRRKT